MWFWMISQVRHSSVHSCSNTADIAQASSHGLRRRAEWNLWRWKALFVSKGKPLLCVDSQRISDLGYLLPCAPLHCSEGGAQANQAFW